MDILNELLASNPLLAVGTGLFAFFVLAIVARLVQNTLIGTKPPVYEEIPFIGGLLKFMQARKLADLSIRGDQTMHAFTGTLEPIERWL